MTWHQGDRGTFPRIPEIDQLPAEARPAATNFARFGEEAKTLRAEALRRQQARPGVVKEYEAAIGQALVAGKKPPPNPLPAYDQEIDDLLHRAEGAGNAAALSFGEVGEQVIAQRETAIEKAEADLGRAVEVAIDAVEALRPALDDVIAVNDRRRWLDAVSPANPGHYGGTSPERSQFDRALGEIISPLRTLRHRLEEAVRQAEAEAAQEEAVGAVS